MQGFASVSANCEGYLGIAPEAVCFESGYSCFSIVLHPDLAEQLFAVIIITARLLSATCPASRCSHTSRPLPGLKVVRPSLLNACWLPLVARQPPRACCWSLTAAPWLLPLPKGDKRKTKGSVAGMSSKGRQKDHSMLKH